MDSRRFDYLVQSLVTFGTRRRFLRIVATLSLATRLLVVRDPATVEAAGRKERHHRSKRQRHSQPSRHRAHQQRDMHGEGCLAAGQRCPQKKGKGKRAKKIGCNRCCDGFTGVDSSGKQVCGCLSNGTTCTPEIASSCCSGICAGSTCQAARCSADSPCPACQTCSGGVCVPVADGTTCDDGDACTQTDTCQSGRCVGSNPIQCPAAPDPCHDAGVCNSATGSCSNPAKPDGTSCNDGDACTQTDTCQGGVCTGSNPVVCNTPPVCHTATGATCNSSNGQCSYPNEADGTACNDGDACTQTDTCQAGACTGTDPVVCPPPADACHVQGTCNPATGLCSTPNAPNGTRCGGSSICCNGTCCTGCCGSGGSCGSCTVFVTSTTHDGNLGGLTGADDICQARATAVSLPGTYKAWLSIGSGQNESPANERFRRSGMPYVVVGGTQDTAENWAGLVDGSLGRKIEISESGTFVGLPDSTNLVWTNTSANGTAGNGNNCGDWNSNLESDSGQVGQTNLANTGWSAVTNLNCDVPAHLYCFQQQ